MELIVVDHHASKERYGTINVIDEHAAASGVLVRRPKTSIYSVMLGISAGALAIGCLVLVLEIWTYGAPWTFPWNIPINLR